MLILNQEKNKIFNVNHFDMLYVEDSCVWITTGLVYLLGSYKSSMEATEVLCDIYRSNGNFAMPKMEE